MAEVRSAFGRAIRFERERRQWRQEDLAQAAGLDRSYVSRVERGDVSPTLDTQLKIAAALGVSLAELMQQAEEEERRRKRRLRLDQSD